MRRRAISTRHYECVAERWAPKAWKSAITCIFLSEVATHLKAEPGGMAAGLQVQCNLAQRLDDATRLEECAAGVAKETPNDPKLPIYQWGVAMKREDYGQARTILANARKSAVATPGIEVMDRMTQEQSALARRAARFAVRYAVPLAVAFAALLALGFGLWFRKRPGTGLGMKTTG